MMQHTFTTLCTSLLHQARLLFLGVPFKPYWDGLGIEFDRDEVYHISYSEYEKNKWHELWVFYTEYIKNNFS